MSTITTDMTINFTKDLKILYAEDDLELQAQTKSFFNLLFSSVTIVNNGLEALTKYKQEPFDIVISDIRMPVMDGLELTSKIKEINPFQNIIIISAYNDSDDLLRFINLNIRQFIQKPIDMENMLETLYFTSKSIVNEKMIEEYRASLEASNKELTEKNQELNSLVRILDAKIAQIAKSDSLKTDRANIKNATMQAEHLKELKELEIDIDGAAVLLELSPHLYVKNIEILGKMFQEYATILQHYSAYEDLAIEIKKLASTLNETPQNFIDRVEDITILLESFIYVLRMWREKVHKNKFTKAIELHTSMINDIQTIITMEV